MRASYCICPQKITLRGGTRSTLPPSKVTHQFQGHILVAFFKSFHLICDMIIKFCEILLNFAMRNCKISHAKNAKFRKAFRFRNANFAMRNFAFSQCENFRKNPNDDLGNCGEVQRMPTREVSDLGVAIISRCK